MTTKTSFLGEVGEVGAVIEVTGREVASAIAGEVLELSTLAREELEGFPAAHLGALPVQVGIALAAAKTARGAVNTSVIWHTGPDDSAWRSHAGAAFGGIAFDGDEVRAIAIGVQADRLRAAELRTFCLRKLQDPEFRVTLEVALDGACADPGAPWSLARVLRALELEPREVAYVPCDVSRSAPSHTAAPGARSHATVPLRSDAMSMTGIARPASRAA